MLLANAPVWIVLLLQQVLWTGLVWLGWQLIRKFISLSPAQIYFTNVVLQLGAAIGFIATVIVASPNDGWHSANNANSFNITYYLTQYPLLAQGLLLLYYLAIAIQVIQWLMGLSGVRRLMYSGVAADAALMDVLHQQQSAIGLPRLIALRVSESVHSPLTIGWLKPVIILPIAAINNLTPKELDALLLHELIHIRRYDYLINHALVLSRALLSFNPFIWLLHEETVLYREISCDDAVRHHEATAVYAGALFRMAQLQQTHRLAMQATGTKEGLRKRIAYMLEPQQVMQVSNSRILITLFGISALALLLFFSARTVQEKRITKQKVKRANTRNIATPKPILAKQAAPTIRKKINKKAITESTIVLLEEALVTDPEPVKIRKTWSDIEPVVEERPMRTSLQQVSSLSNKQMLQQVMQERLVSAAGFLQQLKQEKELTTQEKLWLVNYILQRSGIQFDQENRIVLPEGVDISSLEKRLSNRNLLLRERIIPDSILPKKIQ